ncbi:PepSY-associated TM helix domain-containing protein [Caldimonas sp. KR1-144]|uniref:PepSY-associated TM helix domain-containing protein n=1 Tax=Caldimonas sp. KR1-144 TaxID=3400911 RepID=UPI003C0CB672
MRRTLAWLHRWVSLSAGLLLALLGLTGTLMVWQAELDATLNPQWHANASGGCAASAQPVADTLAVLAREAPAARAALVLAPARPGGAYQVWEARDARTRLRTEHFIDADCGRYLGSRVRGAWQMDRQHAVPALYDLHSRLLAGETGHLVVGAGGLVLLGLAASGIALAWPRGGAAGWRRALGIKTGASRARLWFDVHRASGLWLAPLCLLLAATGAALVFDRQARELVGLVLPVKALPKMAKPAVTAAPASTLAPDELLQRAQQLFPQARWSRLALPTESGGAAEVRLLQPGEPRIDTGSTRVRLDASGKVLAVHDPLRSSAGNVLLDWVFPLHSGEALGLAARVLWSVFGLLPTLLLGSGAWLWWRRTAARRSAAALRAAEA